MMERQRHQPPWHAIVERRRTKIRAEIERNRRGEYLIPTWVLVVALVAVLAGWAVVASLG